MGGGHPCSQPDNIAVNTPLETAKGRIDKAVKICRETRTATTSSIVHCQISMWPHQRSAALAPRWEGFAWPISVLRSDARWWRKSCTGCPSESSDASHSLELSHRGSSGHGWTISTCSTSCADEGGCCPEAYDWSGWMEGCQHGQMARAELLRIAIERFTNEYY